MSQSTLKLGDDCILIQTSRDYNQLYENKTEDQLLYNNNSLVSSIFKNMRQNSCKLVSNGKKTG